VAQQLAESSNRVLRDAREHVTEPGEGLTPQRLQVATKLWRTAAVLPPLSLPKNVQLPRPIAIGRLARSVAPLSIYNSPSSRKRVNAFH
jgi:hypothetical protein